MKVINNKNKYIKFKDLKKGDVFEFGENYFLKIQTIKKDGSLFANAIFIETGDHTLFYGDEEILLINANLVIDED